MPLSAFLSLMFLEKIGIRNTSESEPALPCSASPDAKLLAFGLLHLSNACGFGDLCFVTSAALACFLVGLTHAKQHCGCQRCSEPLSTCTPGEHEPGSMGYVCYCVLD